jgi:geranylgeranyl reductase family protein
VGYDVIVVGGGPAGLIASYEVARAGYGVCVVEEHQEIGYPVKCSGLYSISGLKALNLSLDDTIISNTIKGGRFYSPFGRELLAYSDMERARVVEKKLFDAYLAERAARAGVEFRLKSRAVGLEVKDKVSLGVKGFQEEVLRAELLIAADGVRSSMARAVGLSTPRKIVGAIQVEVPEVEGERDIAEVYFGRRYAPNFYAWVLPKEETWEVGLGVRKGKGGKAVGLREYLRRLLQEHPVASKKVGRSFLELNIGAFPVETVEKTVAERFLLVGDAAGQVKASTGGGVITGGIAARMAGKACVKALEEGDFSEAFLQSEYEDRWRAEIGLELKVHEVLRSLFDALSDEDLERLFNVALEKGVEELMVKYRDTDRPSEFFKEVLRKEAIVREVERFLDLSRVSQLPQ